MSEKPKFYNPATSTKPTDKKNKKEKPVKEKKQQSTRSIRFVKRGVDNVLTYFFWFLLLFLTFLALISYSRYGLVLKKINQKEIDPQEIVTQVNTNKEWENTAKFQGKQFLEVLFTFNDSKTEERKNYLESKLAKGLTENMLTSNVSKVDQQVKSVEWIDIQTVSSKDNVYKLVYNVTTTSNDEEKAIQLSLPVSVKKGDFKVINYPTYLNVKRSDNLAKNETTYQENNFLTKGEKLETKQKEDLEAFTNDFFKLYVNNDNSLKLISNVTGLEKAKLKNVQIKNMVKKGKNYVVEGTYNVSYDGSSELTSFFSLTVEKTKDSYFVSELR